ncbi:MAG: response regulator [Rhodospirillales bacterium]|nr:response regulator [Rhodospirillales bacterium]
MNNLIGITKFLRLQHWLILLAVATLGILGTYSIGQRLEDKAIESWKRQAELDATVATIAAQSWLAQSETIISGLAMGFRHSGEIRAEEFDTMVMQAEEWNSEFSFDAVAVVNRTLRDKRTEVEESLAHALSDAMDSDKVVPDAYAHMVVVNSSETEGMLRPSVDLLTVPEMGEVAKTAQRVPDKAIMGPAYTDKEGHLFTLVGIGLPNRDRSVVIIGQVDLSEMLDVLSSSYIPDGLVLRLSERNDDASADTKVLPIYGSLEAAKDVIDTVSIRVTRGQARWNYNWDITEEYLGGAPTASATMVQIGGLVITMLMIFSVGAMSVQNTITKRLVEDRTKVLLEEVAERKQAEQRLSDSHNEATNLSTLLYATLDSMDQGFAVWDDNNELVIWNDKCKDFWLYPGEVKVGMSKLELLRYLAVKGSLGSGDTENIDQQRLQEIISEGPASSGEFELPDGRHIVIRRYPMQNNYHSALYSDITENLAMEAEIARQNDALHQSEKLSALGELLAGVAHELNNPLSVLVGHALLLQETTSDEKTMIRAKKIGNAADRCARIVKTFLAMARQQPMNRRNMDIYEVIESALEITASSIRNADIEITTEISKDLPVLWGDPDQINQVIVNLIINAQHALEGTNGDRSIHLSSHYDEPKNEVIIRVCDTGNGIPKDVLPRIFDPFFTTKEVGSGTGIGLSFCFRIMEFHGGSITVESSDSNGTTFSIRIPSSYSVDTQPDLTSDCDKNAKDLSVLIIEDEQDVTDIISEILTTYGHTVSTAANGDQALTLLSNNTFDIILSDMRMPEMDGPTLHQKLSELYIQR